MNYFLRTSIIALCFSCQGLCAEEDASFSGPLTLECVETFALEHNKTLQAMDAAVDQGVYRHRAAQSRWWPGATVTAKAERSPLAPGFSYGHNYQGALSFFQTIYSSDVYYGVKVAGLERALAELDLEAFEHDLLFQVRIAYYRVVLAQEELEVQQEYVDMLSQAMESEERRLSHGDSTSYDLNRSKVAVANALSTYYQAVKDLKSSQDQLADLMGLSPDCGRELCIDEQEIPVLAVADLADKIKSFAAGSDQDDGDFIKRYVRERSGEPCGNARRMPLFSQAEISCWESLALEHRPEIRQYELLVDLADSKIGSQRSKYLPTLGAFAHYNSSSAGGDEYQIPQSFWQLGLSVNWTLFDGFGREHSICAARAGLREADIRYEKSMSDAKLLLRDRFYEMEKALLSYFATSQSMNLAKESVEQAKQRRDLGVITSLEYRDTATSQAQARHAFNAASFDLLQAYYALRRDAGIK